MRRSFENVTNLDRLIETVTEGKPHKVTIGSTQITIELIQAGINFAADISDAVGNINAMGKLHLAAQRIRDTRAKLDGEADKLNAKLDGLDQKAPAAFDRAHSIVDSQHADVDQMDSEIRQLSNLPDA